VDDHPSDHRDGLEADAHLEAVERLAGGLGAQGAEAVGDALGLRVAHQVLEHGEEQGVVRVVPEVLARRHGGADRRPAAATVDGAERGDLVAGEGGPDLPGGDVALALPVVAELLGAHVRRAVALPGVEVARVALGEDLVGGDLADLEVLEAAADLGAVVAAQRIDRVAAVLAQVERRVGRVSVRQLVVLEDGHAPLPEQLGAVLTGERGGVVGGVPEVGEALEPDPAVTAVGPLGAHALRLQARDPRRRSPLVGHRAEAWHRDRPARPCRSRWSDGGPGLRWTPATTATGGFCVQGQAMAPDSRPGATVGSGDAS
jgi:hypothetical protein